MELLKVPRHLAKKNSNHPIEWTEETKQAFQDLKRALLVGLEVNTLQPDKPFRLQADASRYAVGAALEQEIDRENRPIAFFSRKLTEGQRKWAPREQETYAIVLALRKWARWIGVQPVEVLTDHRALEHWVTEAMDTPAGPAGRRGRWHEPFSKFMPAINYVPGKDWVVPDAMSRWAYPACKAFQDCSIHGSAADVKAMKEMEREEEDEERQGSDEQDAQDADEGNTPLAMERPPSSIHHQGTTTGRDDG